MYEGQLRQKRALTASASWRYVCEEEETRVWVPQERIRRLARRCEVSTRSRRRSMTEPAKGAYSYDLPSFTFPTDDTRSIIHVWLISAHDLPEVKLKSRLRPYVRYVS